MAELPLKPDFIASEAKQEGARIMILSYLAYPLVITSDQKALERELERKRREYELEKNRKELKLVLGARRIKELQEKINQAPASSCKFERIIDDLSQELGLPKDIHLTHALLDAPSCKNLIAYVNSEELRNKWFAGFDITKMLMKLHASEIEIRGGVSLNKAIDLVECENNRKKQGLQNKNYLRNAWYELKSVIHLVFPFVLALTGTEQFTLNDSEGILMFLALASYVENFLLSIETKHSKEPRLITKEELLIIPSWCSSDPQMPFLKYKVESLTPTEINDLKGYPEHSKR